MTKNDSTFWRLLQLTDSAFPTGGFAHSAGLEAAFHHGELKGPSGLREFLVNALWQLGHGSLPFANAAFENNFRESDELSEVFLSNHVAKRASAVQGRTFMSTCERAYGFQWETTNHHFHYAPVFGGVCRILEFDRASMQRAFLFVSIRGLLSSAVRLGLIGPYQGQEIQTGLYEVMENVLSTCHSLGLDDVAQTAPLIDLYQNNQDRLYSRLFQS